MCVLLAGQFARESVHRIRNLQPDGRWIDKFLDGTAAFLSKRTIEGHQQNYPYNVGFF